MTSSVFDALNDTELFQLARGAELNPHPTMGRDQLIALLEREEEPSTDKSPFDELRDGIYNYLDEHWGKLQSQITCPARAKDGSLTVRSCYGCPDTQVLSCVTSSQSMNRFVQLRRKS
jgi:hypothetical protein